MILNLFEKGFTQRQIALALGTSQATVSRMFPSGTLKKDSKKSDGETN
jgi:predicted transcriptional regulator